ncbi:phosphopyruvate hydratase [Mycoplasma phocoenae]|uniref:Enolase n=1 Tax=Mycoplasma phocoenae TaxID=754517 RepID=A0A858U136_9MOLU|nr:phosphopyruvate hydratase [Mycoplasma phocoenae]QJG66814.1 phosphopyruvate hydratase [Mycoplasma phocoenae]
MSKITNIKAREILDSRGNPTIEVEVWTEYSKATAKVPSGASTGSREALELRDKGTQYEKNWFGGKGVMSAVDNVNNIIAPEIIGMDVTQQRKIDQIMIELDGTEFKSYLGANATLGVSLAVARAAAMDLELPLYRYIGGTNAIKLPLPMLNVINGGEHASNTIDFQEFMIMPVGAKSFREALMMANHVFHTLAKLLKAAKQNATVGDEGGFAPNLHTHEEVLNFLVEAITEAGYNPATSGEGAIAIALDAAASELYDEKTQKYTFKKFEKAVEDKMEGFENFQLQSSFTSDELVEYYGKLIETYPIISIEDSHAESDWEGFEKMTARYGHKVQIVGDDLIVTNPTFIKKAIENKSINAALIKMNQIGTLSETIDAIEMANKANMTAVVSHRSGETEDTTLADLAVAFNTGQIKTGSVSRTDRIAKYNRLLVIEEELGDVAKFDGENTFFNLNR